MTKSEFTKILSKIIVRLKVARLDGSIEIVRATLNPEYYEDRKSKTHELRPDTKYSITSPEKLLLWDVDQDGWRAIKKSRVTQVGDKKLKNGIE